MTAAPGTASDADTLYSDQVVTLDGEVVEVREVRHGPGMRLLSLPAMQRLLADLRALLDAADEPDLRAVSVVLEQHADAWQALECAATGRPQAWLDSLSDEAGLKLQIAAWTANSRFFLRRQLMAAALAQGLKTMRGSPTSSMPSSPPATATTTETSASG